MPNPGRSWSDLLVDLVEDLRAAERGDRGRDERAWLEFDRRVRRYAQAILGIRGHSAVEIDDVVQTVLSKAQDPRFLKRLRATRAPGGYLSAIIRNAARDAFRRQEAERRAVGRLGLEVALHPVELEVAAEDRLAELRRELQRLTPEERELLRLRFWEERTISEIAEMLGTKYSTAAVRLFRLLGRMRSSLEARQGPRGDDPRGRRPGRSRGSRE